MQNVCFYKPDSIGDILAAEKSHGFYMNPDGTEIATVLRWVPNSEWTDAPVRLWYRLSPDERILAFGEADTDDGIEQADEDAVFVFGDKQINPPVTGYGDHRDCPF